MLEYISYMHLIHAYIHTYTLTCIHTYIDGWINMYIYIYEMAGGHNLSPYLLFQSSSAATKEFHSLSWANGSLCRFSVFLLQVLERQ